MEIRNFNNSYCFVALLGRRFAGDLAFPFFVVIWLPCQRESVDRCQLWAALVLSCHSVLPVRGQDGMTERVLGTDMSNGTEASLTTSAVMVARVAPCITESL